MQKLLVHLIISRSIGFQKILRNMVEEVDIGGPCLLRATAKNYHSVLVLPDPAYYGEAMKQLEQGGVDLAFRQRMAARTFRLTSRYDDMIATWLESVAEATL